MHLLRGSVTVAATAALLSGCATSGALRKATTQQEAALAEQRAAFDAALLAERNERVVTDSALRADLGMVRGDLQALRNELQSLRTEFGAKITAMEDGLHFAMPVSFEYDASNVRSDDTPALQRFARIVRQYYPQSKVTVEGFADPAGSAEYNLQLSRRRAAAVTSFLMEEGLPNGQVSPIGYGETRLVTPGASRDQPGANLNRRVVFVIETATEPPMAVSSRNPF
jgi:peptidoglycan-associated lipoprotein